MTRFLKIVTTAALLWTTCGCSDLLIGEVEPNTVLSTYDYFGQEFQERYGLLKVRGIDWPTLVAEQRAMLAQQPTEDNLFHALTSLIDELNDSHVSLSHPAGEFPSYEGGIYGRLERQGYEDFDFDLVIENYVTLIDGLPEEIYYGTIGSDIGYIYLPEISDDPSFYKSYIPGLLKNLEGTKGLIIDLRNNDGGEDEGSRTLASFFADKKTHFMTSRYKIGPGPDDFEKPRKWYVEPVAKGRYSKPVVLLTNRYSISAAETFSLAMKSLPNVLQVGDTTCGAFSDAVSRELPNRWGFTISVGDYRNAQDVSFEGIGLAPDEYVVNTEEDLADGKDKMLEKAVQLLQQ